MGLRVNNNIAALNSYRNLQAADKSLNSSLEKLSSGFRINKAADDAAGLVISEGLRSQIGGMTVAARNAQDGVNVAQTADGALSESTSILQRMRDLATQAASTGTNDSVATGAAQKELVQLSKELDRIASTTAFGSTKLLDGSYGGTTKITADPVVTAVNSGSPAVIKDPGQLTEILGVKIGGVAATAGKGLNVDLDTTTTDMADNTAVKAALEAKANAALHAATGYDSTKDGDLTATVSTTADGKLSVSWTQATVGAFAGGTVTGGQPTELKVSQYLTATADSFSALVDANVKLNGTAGGLATDLAIGGIADLGLSDATGYTLKELQTALETRANAQLVAAGSTTAADHLWAMVDNNSTDIRVRWVQGATRPADSAFASATVTGGDITETVGTGVKVAETVAGQGDTLVLNGIKNATGGSIVDASGSTGLTVVVPSSSYTSSESYVTAVNDAIKKALIAHGGTGEEVSVKNAKASNDDGVVVGYKLELSSASSVTIDAASDFAGFASSVTTTGNPGTFQVGANAGETINVKIGGVSSADLGLAGLNLTTDAASALTRISTAISSVSNTRADLGAIQNRFVHAVNNLNVSIENISASESAIRDTDMAAEMTKFTKAQILSQAGTSMLAQANSSSQNILTLLRG